MLSFQSVKHFQAVSRDIGNISHFLQNPKSHFLIDGTVIGQQNSKRQAFCEFLIRQRSRLDFVPDCLPCFSKRIQQHIK